MSTTLPRKKRPIGIQTFQKIREDNYYYVDKTGFALKLIEDGTHYFLSRPRRFGKSLLIRNTQRYAGIPMKIWIRFLLRNLMA